MGCWCCWGLDGSGGGMGDVEGVLRDLEAAVGWLLRYVTLWPGMTAFPTPVGPSDRSAPQNVTLSLQSSVLVTMNVSNRGLPWERFPTPSAVHVNT